MKLVLLPKGGGKTTEMLMWLLAGHAKGINRALIVPDQARVNRLTKQLQKLYEENGKPEYINNAANRIYRTTAVQGLSWQHFRNMEVGIDDADEILRYLLFGSNRRISIASMTTLPEGTN